GNGQMAKWEAQELCKLIRARIKVAQRAAESRSAELRADFEAKLAAEYIPEDDPVWAELYAEGDKAIAEADARIAERCRERGIPEAFRAKMILGGRVRGENVYKDRRAELRRVANAAIAALEAKAKAEIERQAVEYQTALRAGRLDSAAARASLDSMPTPEVL